MASSGMTYDVIVEERHGGVKNAAVRCPKCRKYAPLYPLGDNVYTVGLHFDKYTVCDGTGLKGKFYKVPTRRERAT